MAAVGLISADQIFDFKIGADKIDLSAIAGTIDDFTEVQGFMSDFGVGTQIAFSEGMMTSHTITLLNVAIANLSASDFLFA